MFKQSMLLLAAYLSLAPLAVRAHDIVLVPQAGGLTLRYGHPHDWQNVDTGKLIEVQAYEGNAAARDIKAAMKPSGLSLVLPAAQLSHRGAVLLAARYDNGLWARLAPQGDTKPKARNTSRLMLPDAEVVSANIKFAKAIIPSPDDTSLYKRRLDHLLELVPQSNPASLKPGEDLDVLVLLRGQPLAGAGIEVSNLVDKIDEDKIQRFVTDASGMARVKLRAKGVQMLGVDVERPNDGSLGDAARALGADKIVMVATYTFVR
jgi:nickel transport protein